jgi:hypothetical protein
MNAVAYRARRKGIGCLPAMLIFLIVGPVFIMAIDWLFAPWIYGVGHRTRWLPVWAGVGAVQTPVGAYKVGIWFSPRPSGSRILPSASVLGSGYVCTPSGKRYTLKVTGGASGRIWNDMDGHEFHLSAYHQPAFASVGGDRRPSLEFSGRWAGADLEMNDEGSLGRAFLPDGGLSPKSNLANAKAEGVPIRFTETGWWWFGGDCLRP